MFQRLLLDRSSVLSSLSISLAINPINICFHRTLNFACENLATLSPHHSLFNLTFSSGSGKKNLHDSIIRPGLEAVSALSWVLVLKAPLSSRYGRHATLLNLLKGSKLPMPLLLERAGIQHLKSDKLPIE